MLLGRGVPNFSDLSQIEFDVRTSKELDPWALKTKFKVQKKWNSKKKINNPWGMLQGRCVPSFIELAQIECNVSSKEVDPWALKMTFKA